MLKNFLNIDIPINIGQNITAKDVGIVGMVYIWQ